MKEILMSHPIGNLKKEIAKTNIKGYSKLKKEELVALMLKNRSKFRHIKKHEKGGAKPPPKPSVPAVASTKKKLKK